MIKTPCSRTENGSSWEEFVLPISSPSGLEFCLSQEKIGNPPDNFGIFLSEPWFVPENREKKNAERKKQKRKNLILIGLDTVRADHLQAYGYSRKTGPVLKEIAEKGTLFKHAYSNAGYTLPSHASLFTGLYSSRLLKFKTQKIANQQEILQGFMETLNNFPENLPALFKKAGYLNAAFTGGGLVDGALGFANGFSRYADFPIELNIKNKTGPIFKNGIQWLRENGKKNPFFLFLHTYEAHGPHYHHELVRHTGKGGRVAESLRDLDAGGLIHLSDYPTNTPIEVTTEEKEYANDLYDSSLLFADHYLGVLMEELEKLKILDNTALVIFGDHGEDIWDHTWWGHGEMFEEILHVPLIFYNLTDTDRRTGIVVQDSVSLLDVFPTLVKQFELKRNHPYPLDGKSLVGPLQNQKYSLLPVRQTKKPFHPFIFSEHLVFTNEPTRYLCFKQGEWKYTAKHNVNENPQSPNILEENLFHLGNDPQEQNNLRDEKPAMTLDLRNASQKMLIEISEPFTFEKENSKDYTLQEEAELLERLKGMGYL